MTLNDRMRTMERLFSAMALAIIYLFGSYASLKAGLTWDEFPEFYTLIVNIKAVHGLLHGDMNAYMEFLANSEKYYGTGFSLPAHFIQQVIEKPVASYFCIDQGNAYLLSKHWVVFNLFFCSGILVRNLMRQFTGDEIFSSLAAIGFLLWPYVFGHAMINVKDIPFMSVWILCTYYSFRLAARYDNKQVVSHLSICLLAVFTGWLVSIRIPGLLISVQYMITVACVWRGGKPALGQVVVLTKHVVVFMICMSLFIYVALPALWLDPLDIFNAIQSMSHHGHGELNACSRTFGICMKGAPPVSYIPLWLSVKLPVAVLAGYLLLPYTYIRLAGKGGGLPVRLFKAMMYTSLSIPVLLMAKHVVMHNEIRHILFLMPLFYCVGMASLYLVSRKIAIASLLASISIFIADQYLAFPYQYVWFNEVARQFKVERYFETDYWGAAGRGLANQLNIESKRISPLNCIYGDPDSLILPFLDNDAAKCFQGRGGLNSDPPRPYLAASFSLSSFVVNCPEIYREKFKLFLGNGDITVGKIQYCK
ncbi:MAG TPA: hypothetical protein PLI90_06590 [Rhodocyclaceae bacterium]|nr:hypothetical protein [Rhodocyclaceae bacterium]